MIDGGWQKMKGDWIPHPERFPRDLRPIADRVRELGMQFGLWIEMSQRERPFAGEDVAANIMQ